MLFIGFTFFKPKLKTHHFEYWHFSLIEILGMKEVVYQILFVLDIRIFTGISGELLNATIHCECI